VGKEREEARKEGEIKGRKCRESTGENTSPEINF